MITINISGKDYQLPSSLMEVTLQQRIDYDEQYGKTMADRLKTILELKDEFEKEMELTDYYLSTACRTLSFFGGIPLEIVQATRMDQVLTVYHHTLKSFSEDVDFAGKEFKLQNEFQWNGDTWIIAPPTLNNDSEMTFGEFLNAKQVIKNLYEVGNEKWSALLALCCVYFRKKGEAYSEEFSRVGSERYELLKTLPFQYALHVAFFLKDSVRFWLKIYLSSDPALGVAARN